MIKMGADLFRVLDLQHFTPGNKRGFVQAKLRTSAPPASRITSSGRKMMWNERCSTSARCSICIRW